MVKKSTRRHERAFAFQVLYGLSFASVQNIHDLRRAFCQSPQAHDSNTPSQDLPQGFAWELVEGVWSHKKALDELITRYSHNWRIDRMGRIELTILRIGLYEMVYCADIPSKVAINEALELSRRFGEDSARAFLNGILDATAKALEHGELEHR